MPFTLKDASGADVQVSTPEEIAEMITGATRSQIEKANKKLSADLTASIGEALKSSIGETLTEFETKLKGELGTKSADQKAPPAGIDEHPTVQGLKKQLGDLKRLADEATAREKAAEAKQRDVSLRQKLTEHLGKIGITDTKQAKGAIALLLDAEKRVRFADDSETLTFKDDDGTEVDLPTGLKSWAKTEDAKIYLPPRGASGSGDRPGGNSRTPGSQGAQPQAGALGKAILGMVGQMEGQAIGSSD